MRFKLLAELWGILEEAVTGELPADAGLIVLFIQLDNVQVDRSFFTVLASKEQRSVEETCECASVVNRAAAESEVTSNHLRESNGCCN